MTPEAASRAMIYLVGLLAGVLIATLAYAPIKRYCHQRSMEKDLPGGGLHPHRRGLVVCTDYNEQGGFGWQLFNALNAAALAEHQQADVAFFFTKGLYSEHRQEHVRVHRRELGGEWDDSNWFCNLFRPVVPGGPAGGPEAWRLFLQKHFSQARRIKTAVATDHPSPTIRAFRRASLPRKPLSLPDMQRLWKTYLRPTEYIQGEVDRIRGELGLDGPFLYAVQYRGSDKYAHSGRRLANGAVVDVSREDSPSHPPYEHVAALVAGRVVANIRAGVHGSSPGDFRVYVASDEQGFVDRMEKLLVAVVSKPDTIRSAVSTSGLDLDTGDCHAGDQHSSACRSLNRLVQGSVHRGHAQLSGYSKARDALVEILLMSTAQELFKSRGNFGNCILYAASDPSLRVHDLASMLARSI